MIDVADITKRYPTGEFALRNLSIGFQRGAINVIIGPSGCGKTTLFHCITGLEPFDYGTIRFNDALLAQGADYHPALAGEIGYVLQGFSLFSHISVLKNLTLAPVMLKRMTKAEAHDRAMMLLDKMKLKHKADAYPLQLSGGQQQRVAIARAIMMNPKVLLLDEPTNALDPQLVQALEVTLRQLQSDGLTLILSTHHLGFAKRIADHSFFMHEGTMIAQSEKAHLLLDPANVLIQSFIQKEKQQEAVEKGLVDDTLFLAEAQSDAEPSP